MPIHINIFAGADRIEAWSKAARILGEKWLPEFHEAMVINTEDTFDALAHGGRFRGVTWAPFKRKPPSRRGEWNALLLQDTGKLKREAATTVFRLTSNEIVFGTRLHYAKRQQRMRPFLFFNLPEDTNTAREIAARFLKHIDSES